MDQTLINRYQAVNPDTGQPGDLYVAYTSQFGVQGANSIASSAQSGDRTAITAAIEQLKYGAPLPTSTAAAFGNQLLTDPFAAPLAYTGLGSLLIMNRMVANQETEWAQWVIFFALGGFVGNFIFTLTDHAQNGFFHRTEWIPVISSAVAVGFLILPLALKVDRLFLRVCGLVMLVQVAVGGLGLIFHALADWHNHGENLFLRVVHGAPIFAPTLFCDLAVLASIGLWGLWNHQSKEDWPRHKTKRDSLL